MAINSFYSEVELKELGLKSCGKNVLISKKCSIYDAENISVGSNVRIDDFCILSGKIEIGNYVHISPYCALHGKAGIKIGDFCGISSRGTIYSVSDDFSGEFMISPMVPYELTNVKKAKVTLNNYVQLGANTVVLPGVVFGEGSVTGACTLILKNTKEWTINAGIPAREISDRKKNIIELSKKIKDFQS
ncbi:MAG: acyltransferase [Endomicrobium sp.]|jgi:galactoside O-acetyltransferase|nr:acyltransferase [Endomicrobium sp.]